MPPVFSLDQIKTQLQTQWAADAGQEGQTRTWHVTDIDYALPDTAPTGDAKEEDGFVKMTATEKAFIREAFEMWDDLIAVNLNETTSENARITVAYSSNTGDSTYTTATVKAPPPDGNDQTIVSERIWMSSNADSWPELQSANLAYGNRGLENYLHEIGHALGLSHPGSYSDGDDPAPTYDANAEYSQDTQQWTVMSYFDPGDDYTPAHFFSTEDDPPFIDRFGSRFVDVDGDGFTDRTYVASPLLHDIAAIQAKYGADLTTRTGDDVYGFHASFSGPYRGAFDFNRYPSQNPVIAIWDAGGDDRLDASGFSQNQRIDLHAGAFSDIGALTLNVAIAYGVNIENATGGSGNDSITGNDGDNILNGLRGDDVLIGEGGADLLHGNEGNDTLIGGFGFVDTLYGDAGDDTYIVDDFDTIVEFSGFGIDTVRSSVRWVLGDNLENLILTGANNINGFGNALDNVLVGNSGNNYLQGFAGFDTLAGGAGNDYYELSDLSFVDDQSGWRYDDVLEAPNGGIDTVSVGYHGNDRYYLDANIENVVVADSASLTVIGNDLDNVFTGNAGHNLFYGQGGADTLDGRGGYDDLLGGAGNDTYILDDLTRPSQLANFTFDGVSEAAGEGIDTVLVRSLADPNKIGTNAYTLTANVENGTITGTDVFNLRGNELDNVLTGNNAANTLTGNNGDDTLNGLGGFDTLIGGAGNDTYVLADLSLSQYGQFVRYGYDTVSEGAGAGLDTVVVTAIDNPDTFRDGYTLGANIEYGMIVGTLAFNLTGNELDNVLTGNDAANTLIGNDGDDTFYGLGGFDTLIGGAGNDTYVLADLSQSQSGQFVRYGYDTVSEDAGAGIDTIVVAAIDNPDTISTRESYTLGANVENGTIVGTLAFNLAGNELDNVLTGNDAANTLTGNDGNDTIDGGAGADVAVFRGARSDYVIALLPDSRIQVVDSVAGRDGTDLLTNIEKLQFSDIDVTSSSLNGFVAGPGNDPLVGDADPNEIQEAPGDDVVIGGLGDDIYHVDSEADVVIENADEGNDTIYSTVNYTLPDNVETLFLEEGAPAAINGAGNDVQNFIYGNSLDNALSGYGGDDVLVGGAGNDILDGGVGNDAMAGGLGDDTYHVDSEADAIIENANEGTDTVFATINYTLSDNFETLFLVEGAPGAINAAGNGVQNFIYGNSLDNALSGYAGDDVLVGGAGNDILDGGIGDDAMAGGAGDDTYYVDSEADAIIENADEGTDTVFTTINYTLSNDFEILFLVEGAPGAINGAGNSVDNRIYGNSLNNALSGNAGHDTLVGGAGNDLINGGADNDLLHGGAGNDTFVFAAGEADGDIVLDFAGNGSDPRATASVSSASAPRRRARPLPRSVRRTIGRSTRASTATTRPSRSTTAPRCTRATACSGKEPSECTSRGPEKRDAERAIRRRNPDAAIARSGQHGRKRCARMCRASGFLPPLRFARFAAFSVSLCRSRSQDLSHLPAGRAPAPARVAHRPCLRRSQCAGTSVPCSISSRRRPRTRSGHPRCNSCASSAASRIRRKRTRPPSNRR